MKPRGERLFQKKYDLLAKLKKNLAYLNHQILFQRIDDCLPCIEQNERIVLLLSKLDSKLNTLGDSSKNLEIYPLLKECLELQKNFETRWNELTKFTKIELTELEVKRQLRESLRKKFEF